MQLEIAECYEDVNDALKAAVMALGGMKKVGGDMRPELPAEDAKNWLKHCLTPDRREKLSLEQVMWILREARRAGFHATFDFFAQDAGYKAQPVDMTAQVASMEATINANLEKLNAQIANLTRLKERVGA